MGADLFAGNEHFRDNYNQYGLMSVIAGTLDAGSMQKYSWWRLCDNYATLNIPEQRRESTPEQLNALLALLEGALVDLSTVPVWYYGYDSGTPLASYEKEKYSRKLVELLGFLRFAKHRNEIVVWSV